MPADFFLTNSRVDIIAKYLYAKYRECNYDTPFALNLYKRHLEVWNGFDEIDNTNKKTFDSFVHIFHDILDSIKAVGYDNGKSSVPVTEDGRLLNGSHRVASCLLYDKPVLYHTTTDPSEGQVDCSSFYFRALGLDEKYLDAMAVEYSKLKKNAFIISLFPSAMAMEKMGDIQRILTSETDVIHIKDIFHANAGPLNIVRQLYLGESWGGGWENNFSGIIDKARLCFTNSAPMRVFLVELNDVDHAKKLKGVIRDLYQLENHSCHINDTHDETVRLSRVFFNDNSIHYMNSASLVYYPKFYEMLDYYKRFIDHHSLDSDEFCVTASSILSLYGLREGQDLDYLHGEKMIDGHPEIHSHNNEIYNYTTSKDDILYNPENHFYFDGIKFASLNIIKQLKEKRSEPKDIVDIGLIENIL